MHQSLPERIIAFSVRHARAVVIATIALSLVFGWFAIRVRINPDFTSLLPQDAEVNKLLKEYGAVAATPDLLVFAVTATDGGLFTPERLAAYGDAVRAISALPGVESTVSPFNLVSFGRENGRLSIRPMSPGGREPGADSLDDFRARLDGTSYARNLVVSADHTMLIAYFQTKSLGSYKGFMASVDPIVAAAKAKGLTPYVTGTIPLSVRTEYHLSHDVARLLGLAALIMLLCYIVGFRSARAIVLPLFSTLLGTLWTVGFMGMAGFSLSLITIVAPPLILIFGNEYNIFTTSEYLRVAGAEGTSPGWIERAARNVAKPITMAFLTTIIGFMSLLFTSIRQTREFAVAASFGSLACAFLALFFLPALYALMKPPVVRERHTDAFLGRVMTGVARFAWRFPGILLAFVGAAVVLFVVTLPRLVFNTDPASYFPQNDPVLRDMSAIYSKVGGYEQASVSFDAPEGATGYFLSADALSRVESVEQKLREIPDLSYSVSLPGLLRDINKAATGQDAIPTNRVIISTFSRLLLAAGGSSPTGSVIGTLANKDFTRVTITFRIWNSSTGHYMDEARFRQLVGQMNKVLADNPTGARAVVWSDLLRNLSFADSLRGSLFVSMVFSVLSILVLTILVFRSPFFGLYPVIPLATGLLLNFAMMSLTRIPLDMTTIMVANIAIGVGVDSAIYTVIQYRREIARLPDDPRGALEQTLRTMGKPVLLSSLSIVFGLLTFVSAAFRPIVYFGVLVLFTLFATTAGILVVLPAVLGIDTRIRARRAHRRLRAEGTP